MGLIHGPQHIRQVDCFGTLDVQSHCNADNAFCKRATCNSSERMDSVMWLLARSRSCSSNSSMASRRAGSQPSAQLPALRQCAGQPRHSSLSAYRAGACGSRLYVRSQPRFSCSACQRRNSVSGSTSGGSDVTRCYFHPVGERTDVGWALGQSHFNCKIDRLRK